MKSLVPALIAACALVLACCSGQKEAKIETREIVHTADSIQMKGYLAYNANQEGKRPGILVVHEWWGLNEYVRHRARMLAGLGYVAFAVDMFGDGKSTTHPDDAGKFAMAVMQNMPGAKARFMAASEVLRSQPVTDTGRIAAIGYCFGGGVVLAMATTGADLKGVVSFHGSLAGAQTAPPGTVKASILVCNGADDPFAPQTAIDQFKKTMSEDKADYIFISYPGAKHAFTNPDADSLAKGSSLPLAYNEAADRASWSEMQKFLQKIFAE